MKTSTERILTTHVGSIPRPESVRALLRARLGGQRIDEAELAAKATEAVTDVVRRQGEVGLRLPLSDGEMSKTSFLGYTDDRLTGFASTTAATDPSMALTAAGGAWARRVDSRREWRAFREYYTEYLPREMPMATPPTAVPGPHRLQGPGGAREGPDHLQGGVAGRHGGRGLRAGDRAGHGRARPESLLQDGRRVRLRHRRGAAHGVPGDRGCRLHLADRRSGPGRDVGHADPGAAARGVPQDAGAQPRSTEPRAGRHPRGPRALPPGAGEAGRARTCKTFRSGTWWIWCSA